MSRHKRTWPPVQVSATTLAANEADNAYEAFAAMRRLACQEPHLIDNAYFTALQDTAYARFLMLFKAL